LHLSKIPVKKRSLTIGFSFANLLCYKVLDGMYPVNNAVKVEPVEKLNGPVVIDLQKRSLSDCWAKDRKTKSFVSR
jgi:hypothetical protein